ncbi:hypothetical protein HON52_01115 [Candidatus Uhrbacteria bacterium]|jgi:hypothetical protein|nr:hypothetical protein [Candidatus Uhrbacteria bacterium]
MITNQNKRMIAFSLFFALLTVVAVILPSEHWFHVLYLTPATVGFSMISAQLSGDLASPDFIEALSVIVIAFPTLLYTLAVVGIFDIVDRIKANQK